MLHTYPSIPKTQKYVSPAAASWPGGRGGGGANPNPKTKTQETKTREKYKRQDPPKIRQEAKTRDKTRLDKSRRKDREEK